MADLSRASSSDCHGRVVLLHMDISLRPRTIDLDEHDLGAHCGLRITLYGNESVRVSDLRGEAGDGSAWMVVDLKNLAITGRLSSLRALGAALVDVCDQAMAHPEEWSSVPARRARAGLEVDPLTSAFTASLGDTGPSA